jgi:YHS domain-containing protein
MIRSFLIDFVFPILLFFLVRAVLRNVFTAFRTPPQRSPERARQAPPPVQTGGELRKDPVCGTYVSTTASVTRTVNGQVVHFCSKECRDRYKVA